ncbi:MAG TPA: class I SAM-dependent methyltransferase [Candidatus Acidoferrum sp.]|nr:class I SAM-dependent methyltransferase [Candidatus Acidoferrum sp.]
MRAAKPPAPKQSLAVNRVGPLSKRYSRVDLTVFSDEERRRLGVDDHADPGGDLGLAWELLYRLEPELYDRLVSAERLHPGILQWLPTGVDHIVEVAAGTGRLTMDLLGRCQRLTAIEPADPLRELLRQKIERVLKQPRPFGAVTRVATPAIELISGFFDALPVADRVADLVIACSALTPEPAHGGERGLAEMERVCARGGMVVIVWPNGLEWLARHGYRHVSFPGDMAMEFASVDEAIALTRIFYPQSVDDVDARGDRRVRYEVLGVNPPRDLAYKHIT